MLSESIVKSFHEHYPPVQFFDPSPTLKFHQENRRCDCTCSYRQKNKMMQVLEDSMATLESLCNEFLSSRINKLQIKKILILCSEVLEIAQTVPSVAQSNKTIDMRVDVPRAIVRLAAKLDDYYNNPSSITKKSIEKDVIRVVDHIYE